MNNMVAFGELRTIHHLEYTNIIPYEIRDYNGVIGICLGGGDTLTMVHTIGIEGSIAGNLREKRMVLAVDTLRPFTLSDGTELAPGWTASINTTRLLDITTSTWIVCPRSAAEEYWGIWHPLLVPVTSKYRIGGASDNPKIMVRTGAASVIERTMMRDGIITWFMDGRTLAVPDPEWLWS